FHSPAPSVICTLSLHDALPIYVLEDERLAIDRIDLIEGALGFGRPICIGSSRGGAYRLRFARQPALAHCSAKGPCPALIDDDAEDRKSTRLNSSHLGISYAVFC